MNHKRAHKLTGNVRWALSPIGGDGFHGNDDHSVFEGVIHWRIGRSRCCVHRDGLRIDPGETRPVVVRFVPSRTNNDKQLISSWPKKAWRKRFPCNPL